MPDQVIIPSPTPTAPSSPDAAVPDVPSTDDAQPGYGRPVRMPAPYVQPAPVAPMPSRPPGVPGIPFAWPGRGK